jgi:nucleotide-binding universal stress UspA family protein
MKSILLYVSQGNSMEGRFQAALNVARSLGAHITCLQSVPFEGLAVADPLFGAYPSGDLVAAVREGEDEQRAVLEARLGAEAVSWNWIRRDEAPAQSIIEHSRLADLVILGLPSRQSPEAGISLSLVSDVAVHARAPLLAVPAGTRPVDCFGTAIIAWNGSMESAHATRLAVPLLAKAESVRIVEVAENGTGFPATGGAEYLSRHGIHAELCEWPRKGRPISEVLLEAAKSLGGSYIVAGAYGHTRFREAILGGVSRELIQDGNVALLLAH